MYCFRGPPSLESKSDSFFLELKLGSMVLFIIPVNSSTYFGGRKIVHTLFVSSRKHLGIRFNPEFKITRGTCFVLSRIAGLFPTSSCGCYWLIHGTVFVNVPQL